MVSYEPRPVHIRGSALSGQLAIGVPVRQLSGGCRCRRDIQAGGVGTDMSHSTPRRSRWTLRHRLGLVGLVAALLVGALLAASSVQVGYYAVSPGPVGFVNDFVTTPDPADRGSSGELLFLTVQIEPVSALEYLGATLNGEVDLKRREQVRPQGVSSEEHHMLSLDQIDESKQTAVFVALSRLGRDVDLTGAGALVADVAPASPAAAALVPGDIIVAVDGTAVEFAGDVIAALAGRRPGDSIVLGVDRDGQSVEATVTLGASPGEPTRAFLGVSLETVDLEVDIPDDVAIETRNVGGPSAGLMFTLGIIDALTADDLTRGHRIAGTGTIRLDGDVGPIGGVRQKVIAARDAGAGYVLVPTGNLADALDAAGDDIEVVAVDTVDDALGFLAGLPAG